MQFQVNHRPWWCSDLFPVLFWFSLSADVTSDLPREAEAEMQSGGESNTTGEDWDVQKLPFADTV